VPYRGDLFSYITPKATRRVTPYQQQHIGLQSTWSTAYYARRRRRRWNALACEVASSPLISRRSRKPLAFRSHPCGPLARVDGTGPGGS